MSDEYSVQVSISLPPAAQYAKGDMINFRGADAAEVYTLLDEALSTGLLEKAAEASAAYLAASGLGAKTESVQPAASSGGPNGRSCKHGSMVYREGYRGDKKWSGYFCPEKSKSQQCDVVWL